MKSTLLFIFFCILICPPIMAQRPRGTMGELPEAIREKKIAYIKETLQLAPKDSVKFWPVYDQYEKEKMELYQKSSSIKRSLITKSDSELKAAIEKILALKEKEVQVEKKYLVKFEEVITIRQIAALYMAENQFKQKLLQHAGGGER